MINHPSERKETRYGMPAADQILHNRHYVIGYSYYFRQPKWALEIVDPPTIIIDEGGVDRQDNFRSDFRIPSMFRADKVDFVGSGFDRGHMVPSADLDETRLQNSETFLLSNMSPQHPRLNRQAWRILEERVRELNAKPSIYETYVVSGPIFNFDVPVATIGNEDNNEVTIPVPHAYFKSILTEDKNGRLHMWSFMMPNAECDEPLSFYQVPTTKVEQYAGIRLWDGLQGSKVDREKSRIRRMW